MLFHGQGKPGKLLMRNGRVYDVRRAYTGEPTDILVVDGRIARIGKTDDIDAQVIDIEGRVVMPGFIEAHAHLCFSESMSTVSRMPADEACVAAQANLALNLRAGITTVRDVGSAPGMVEALRDLDRPRLHPRVICSGPVLTTPRGHCWYAGLEVSTQEQIDSAINSLRESGVDLVKVMMTGGRSTSGTNANATQFSLAQLGRITRLAHEADMKVACHAHALEGIRFCNEAQVDSIEHGSSITEGELRQMARDGIFYVPTLLPARLVTGLDEAALERVRNRRAMTRAAFDLGVPVAAGTDAGIKQTPHGLAARETLEFIALGIPPQAAIRALTLDAARLLGVDSFTGSVDIGKYADLLVLSEDPTHNPKALLSPPYLVFKEGELCNFV